MPSTRRSRSRTLESEDDSESRANTPISTARNDSKRAKLGLLETSNVQLSTPSQSRISTTVPASAVRNHVPTPTAAATRSRYQPGAIVRVKLTNFVTYTSAEFFPGPNLNMVIGPNGTGKSTLVCAICLGLGWGTQYLGRAKDAAEFVKHGCREATIEIELQRREQGPGSTRRNPVIRRNIKKEGNKSTYFLNGNSSTGKAVQTLAQTLNIQIDNLCQFLPQDKVVEFAQMTPVEILSSTIKAASGSEMIQMHENLKKLRTAQREAMADNRGDREELKNLQDRQEMQRTEVERMRERAVVKKRLQWLEKCRPIPLYSVAKKLSHEAKAKEKELSRELVKLREESGPSLKKVTAKQVYEKNVRQYREQIAKEVTTKEKACDAIAKDIDNLNGKMQDLDHNYEAESKSVKPKREEMGRLRQKIVTYNRMKENEPEKIDAKAINEEIGRLTQKKRQLELEEDELEARKGALMKQGQERKNAGLQLQKRLEGLDTQTGQKASRLASVSKDTSTAWEWIQEHRDTFDGNVYGPPLVECALKDPRKASAMEGLLQENDFKIITVQNQKDFTLLQQKLMGELKLHDISLRHCSIESLDQLRPPLSEDEMQKFGLASWAIDEIEGPAPVLAMLCAEKNLHQCALAARDVNQQQHDALAQSAIRSYVAGGKCYQFVRRAEYGSAGNVARTRALRPARMWTDQPVDLGRKAALEREIAEKKGEIAIIKAEFDEVRAKFQETITEREELSKKIDQIREEKDTKQKALTEWKGLDTKIAEVEEKIEKTREAVEGVRERQIQIVRKRDEILFQKAELVLRYAAATRTFKELQAKLIEVEVMHIEAVSDFHTLKSRNEQTLATIRQMQKEVDEATEVFRVETQKARELVRDVQNIQNQARRLQEEGDQMLANLLEEFGEARWSTDELEAQIDGEKARLELTEGGSTNIIQEFEERAKKIERLETRGREFDERQADFKHGINEIRQQWEPRLDDLVGTISNAFADSFARIGCAGVVQVYKASSSDPADCTEENGGQENGLDFVNWAIHISVKFRDNEPLSLLDSHRQSGGERAVSTVFYLMALQSLSRAPFRVVDEINQGMDPRNERMVHGRMVDIATDDGGSQYFLITPKLLNGLKYRPGMTVLCIVSGENMPATLSRDDGGQVVQGPKIDFRAFVAKARELQLSENTASMFASARNSALTAEVGA